MISLTFFVKKYDVGILQVIYKKMDLVHHI